MGDYNTEQMCEFVLSRMQELLEKDGYRRNGKGTIFYRYHADRRIACVLGMQKSVNNCYGNFEFTFNVGCVSIDDVMDADPNFFGFRLTLAVLKEYLRSCLSDRIGFICRGYDVWYDLSEYGLMGRNISQYYNDTILPDIEKVRNCLNEQVVKKLSKYES